MELSGSQFKQLQDALLDAYTEFGLRQMLRVQMDVDFERVTGGDNLTKITHNLIRWAEQRGQLERLIAAAHTGNQENTKLAALVVESKSWFAGRDETPPPLNDLAPARAPSSGYQIFLSYSRKDSRQMQTVHRALTDAGLSVWTDEGLAVGTNHWEAAIEAAIEQAECMVVLMSPDAKQSKWVNAEISYAQEIGLGIFPVLLRGDPRSSIPLALRSVQYEDGQQDLAGAAQRVAAVLCASDRHPQYPPLGPAEDEKLEDDPKTTKRPHRRKWWLAWLLVPLAVVLLALAFWWGKNNWPLISPETRQIETPIPLILTLAETPAPTLTPTPKPGTVREINGIPFVYVPAGEFEMGTDDGEPNQRPVHTVDLDSYWIMQTEVTNAQYAECVDAGVCFEPNNDLWSDDRYSTHPVTYVNWSKAVIYANWLSGETGQTIELPTEAQWERAARGTDERIYPWGDDWDPQLTNYCDDNCDKDSKDTSGDDGFPMTAPVGSYPDGASPVEALDMAGNVWEWTADWYADDYYANSPERNPQGPHSGDSRVIRGGSWTNKPSDVTVLHRNDYEPDRQYARLGFRLVYSGDDSLLADAEDDEPGLESRTTQMTTGVPTSRLAIAPTATFTPTISQDKATPTPIDAIPETPAPAATLIPPMIFNGSVPAILNAESFTLVGQAHPGAIVEILVNDGPLGYAATDAEGYWTFDVTLDEPGEYLLSVRASYSDTEIASVDLPSRVIVPSPTPSNTPTLSVTPTPQAGTVREIGGIPFVYVPAGEFEMGSNHGDDDEQPIHTVSLDSYWIMQTEMTNTQYAQCVDAGYCREPNNDRWRDSQYSSHPVTHVSWHDAVAYAVWLSRESGFTVRLLTEAEWEKAARGTDGRIYPWGNTAPNSSLLNYSDNEDLTTIVGNYPDGASPYGVLDMAGNVWEWTSDWYDSDYYAGSPTDNPQGPESGDRRVGRGGAFYYLSSDMRSADRGYNSPGYRRGWLGIRLASPGHDLLHSDAETVSDDAVSVIVSSQTPMNVSVAPSSTSTMTPTPEAGTVREIGSVPFVYVPAGEFEMGSSDEQVEQAHELCNKYFWGNCAREWYEHEQPQHTVFLDEYWVMQTEVTNEQYVGCVNAGDCREPNNDRWNDSQYRDHPVTDVSWDDAVAFADWLSVETGRTMGLPTEAEWEKAARGTDARTFPWGDEWDPSHVNYCDRNCERAWKDETGDDGFAATAPVGNYPDGASPFGASDMAGNVWEWTADWYNSYYYAYSQSSNPEGPESGDHRVVRGGAWSLYPNRARAAYRLRKLPDDRSDNLGFRLASHGF